MNYRADIDGLRAVAVLSVVLFHLNEQFLTGGFVGVDIFFVISGYLITKLIVSEISQATTFSFKTFYVRRVRRLFPALFFTFLVSLILAYFVFSPQHLASFGESAVFATTSLSNFLFWSQSSYFDQDNLFKPLLHTWSLSIEEQFYFIWPSLLVLLYWFCKPKIVPWLIIFLGVGSLLLNLYFLFNAQEAVAAIWGQQAAINLDIRSTMFYLLPFRVFEFSVGAILVWVPAIRNRLHVNELLFSLGLLLIIYSLIAFDSTTLFPYFNALVPCVGAALVIASGPNHALAILLKNRLMVSIGLISYSLYLIHWPIIVFYNYWKYESLTSLDYVLITVASIVVAIAMYKYVEQPFRKKKTSDGSSENNKPFLLGSAALALILCLASWNAHTSAGWLWRYPADVVKQLDFKKGDYTEFFWHEMEARQSEFSNNGSPKVLIVGDSMAADVINALSSGGLAKTLDITTFQVKHHCRGLLPLKEQEYQNLFGGLAKRCVAEHLRFELDPRLERAEVIILASYWREPRYIKLLSDTVQRLNKRVTAKIFVAGIKDQTSNGIYFFTKNISSPHLDKLRTPVHPTTLEMNSALAKLPGEYEYFSLLDQFCSPQGCQRVTKSGHVIIFDMAHLSPQGAQFVGNRLAEAAWYKKILSANSRSN